MPVMALTMLLNTVVTPTPNACTATIATTAINAATMEYSTIVWPRSPATRRRSVHRVCMGLTSFLLPCLSVRLLSAEAEELRPGGVQKHNQEHREDEDRHRRSEGHTSELQSRLLLSFPTRRSPDLPLPFRSPVIRRGRGAPPRRGTEAQPGTPGR